MPTKFQCGKCKTWLEGNDAAAGEEMECPNCGNKLIVPELPPAPESAEEADEQVTEQLDPVEDDAADELAAADAEGEGEGEDAGQPEYSFSTDYAEPGSPAKWFVMLGILLAVLGYFVYRTMTTEAKKKDEPNVLGIKEDNVTDIRLLYDQAETARKEGRTQEAIKLYEQYIDQAEKLPDTVRSYYDIEGTRKIVESLKTGKPIEEPATEPGEKPAENPAGQ